MPYPALLVSLKTACAAIIFTFFLGLGAARLVGGIKPGRLKFFLDSLFTLPLVLPPTVLGFFLLVVFGANRPLGRFLIDVFSFRLAFSWAATVLAAVVASFPLMYRSARAALEQVDPDLLDAARTLGLSEWRIFRRVTFPLALPGVAVGTVLAFVRGLGEFGATAMIAGNIEGRTRTLPLAIYSAAAGGDMANAAGAVAVLVGLSLLAMWAVGRLLPGGAGRRNGKDAA